MWIAKDTQSRTFASDRFCQCFGIDPKISFCMQGKLNSCVPGCIKSATILAEAWHWEHAVGGSLLLNSTYRRVYQSRSAVGDHYGKLFNTSSGTDSCA